MSDAPKPSRLRLAAGWLIVIGAATFAAVFLFGAAWDILHEAWLLDVAREHFAAAIGLPFAALAALVIVVILEISAGPVQFEGFGLKFSGAAGPVVFWILVFLAISASIKLLW
jgi:hypothetical protein